MMIQAQGCASITARPTVDPVLADKEAAIQKRMAVEGRMAMFNNLSRVSLPILANGVPLCGEDVTYYIGMDTYSSDGVAKEWREPYREVLGVDEYVTVTHVFAGTPAQEAGLQAGDKILMMNARKVAPGETCYAEFLKRMGEEMEGGATMTFWVERKGMPKYVEVRPRRLCDYPVVMVDSDTVNAYADGHSVMVTRGMLKFTQNDDELALIVGHELGHNVMDHVDKTKTNRVFGAIVDGLIAGLTGVYTNAFANAAGMAYSQEYEQEADYLGIYFMERAGYDGTSAPQVWRRMGAEYPQSITHASTHPTSASRSVFFAECIKEIEAKRVAGQDLLPALKETASK
jgi:membrane-associated protease RseP (regulator of RpoE activity)